MKILNTIDLKDLELKNSIKMVAAERDMKCHFYKGVKDSLQFKIHIPKNWKRNERITLEVGIFETEIVVNSYSTPTLAIEVAQILEGKLGIEPQLMFYDDMKVYSPSSYETHYY